MRDVPVDQFGHAFELPGWGLMRSHTATATVIPAVVLAQISTAQGLEGIALVMFGIALHRPAAP